MAASDPTTRRIAASVAARARVAALSPDERRDMTAAARAALHVRDLKTVDEWALRTGRYPLPEHERQQWATTLRRERAVKASLAAAEARRRRTALAATLRAEERR